MIVCIIIIILIIIILLLLLIIIITIVIVIIIYIHIRLCIYIRVYVRLTLKMFDQALSATMLEPRCDLGTQAWDCRAVPIRSRAVAPVAPSYQLVISL